MKSNRSQVRGMTLLEVLVALGIFATAAISVVRAVSQHINTLSYLEEKTFASMVAENQLAKVHLSPTFTTKQQGTEELAGRQWYWTATPVKTESDLLLAVDLAVASDEAHKNTLLTVRTYVKP